MKKIAMLLAMLLCLAPVLSACGANSSPEAAAEAAFVAEFIDCSYEDYYEVAYLYNLDLLDDLMDGSEKLEGLKDTCRSRRDSKKESIKDNADDDKDYEKYDVTYDIRYSISYEKDSKGYDNAMKTFGYKGTDIEDAVDEVAYVGLAFEISTTDDKDNDEINGSYYIYTCFKIDGDWYVADFADALSSALGGLGGLLG